MAKIETRTVLSEGTEPSLENSTFYIKDYQRGYRWEEQQVKSLLDDLLEFNHDNHTLKYCMQPLVVKKAERNAVAHTRTLSELITPDAVKSEETESSNCDSAWELIDGQQRLTTTLLVLNCCYEALKKPPAPPYQIYYQLIRNIDEYYINHAKKVIDDWFDSFGSKSDDIRSEIRGKINSDIQFIWYEVESNANSVEIFTKLNIGKIPLTNAELFKAQLLNPDRIDKKDREKEVKENVTLASIAFEWDKIEQSLRDNDFWSFISNEMLDAETRIDYLLRLYAIQIKYEGEIDSAIQEADGLFPFLAINSYIRKHKMDSNSIACNETIWKEIVSIHDRLKSWYTNNKLYHYIGFLIATGKSGIKVITELVKDTDKKKKSEVKEIVFDKIRKQMKNVTLDNLSYSKDSQRIRSVLLFFNLFTMVQSKTDSRFSFKQYKDPKIHWDIEHIHARATDEEIRAIKDPDKRKDFLESLKKQFEEINDQEAVQKINQFILTEVNMIFDSTTGTKLCVDDSLFRRALLTYGDYSIWASSTHTLFFEGGKGYFNWRRMLRESLPVFSKLFDDLKAHGVNTSGEIEDFLQDSINKFNDRTDELIYYMVKTPALLNYMREKRFRRSAEDAVNGRNILYSGARLSTDYAEAYSFCAYCKLPGDDNAYHYGRGYLDSATTSAYIERINGNNVHIAYDYSKKCFCGENRNPMLDDNGDVITTVEDLLASLKGH